MTLPISRPFNSQRPFFSQPAASLETLDPERNHQETRTSCHYCHVPHMVLRVGLWPPLNVPCPAQLINHSLTHSLTHCLFFFFSFNTSTPRTAAVERQYLGDVRYWEIPREAFSITASLSLTTAPEGTEAVTVTVTVFLSIK